jgi:hypothetical protein
VTEYDRLIDDVAKEMTAAAPPSDLRERVLAETGGTSLQARLEHEAKASYHRKLGWLAAAAGLLLAMYLGWPEREAVEPPAPPAVTQAPSPVGPRPARPSDIASRPQTPAGVRRPAAPRPPEPVIASIPELGSPEALGIAPLDAGATPVPALDVAPPLEIETLDIKPLTSPPAATGGQ